VSDGSFDLGQAATEVVEAFNASDWDRMRSMLGPEVIYIETGTARRLQGVEAHVGACQAWKAALPDVRGRIALALAADSTVALELIWQGTHTGPLPTPAGVITPSGASVTVPASLWMRFEVDKVAEVHHYLDVLALLQQIGAIRTQPPEPA
jgi:steroid delta-isomerase-like uncharacterized protein